MMFSIHGAGRMLLSPESNPASISQTWIDETAAQTGQFNQLRGQGQGQWFRVLEFSAKTEGWLIRRPPTYSAHVQTEPLGGRATVFEGPTRYHAERDFDGVNLCELCVTCPCRSCSCRGCPCRNRLSNGGIEATKDNVSSYNNNGNINDSASVNVDNIYDQANDAVNGNNINSNANGNGANANDNGGANSSNVNDKQGDERQRERDERSFDHKRRQRRGDGRREGFFMSDANGALHMRVPKHGAGAANGERHGEQSRVDSCTGKQ